MNPKAMSKSACVGAMPKLQVAGAQYQRVSGFGSSLALIQSHKSIRDFTRPTPPPILTMAPQFVGSV